MWDLTEVCSVSGITQNTPLPSIPCLNIPAHQSGINSLAAWVDKQDSGCQVTVASGGDDGQLTISVIRVQYPKDQKTGGSRESFQISDSLRPQRQLLEPSSLVFHLNSQQCIPEAHAAPLTALKLLRPGIVASTSADQRVCLWKVGSASVGQIGSLCSHVADAAGLAVWAEEEVQDLADGIRKNGFDPEQQNPICERRGTTVKKEHYKIDTEAGFLNKEGTADESGSQEASNQTGQPVSRRNMKDDEAADESRRKTGWVLVCGQGFQLLHISDPEQQQPS